MKQLHVLVCVAATAGLSVPALAQHWHLVNDRTNDTIFLAHDANDDGAIDETSEVSVFFDATNAAGTLAISNPTCLGIGGNGAVCMGDQGNRVIYFLRDLNCDGDVQDLGESVVYADATNLSGISFAFPTGSEFGPDGALYVVNAGNASGDDGLYRLVDLNSDGDAQDAGEITTYLGSGAFGTGNGPYAPQEFVFDANGVGYLHNSSSTLFGVYRFEDIDSSGNADDPGEFTVFWDANNADTTPASAGFSIDLDRARPRAFYLLQLASGGVDQLVRIQDVNDDGDAQDAGESAIVWSTAEAGFTSVDAICLDNGDVLVTDNSGNRVIRLHDGNSNGDFMDVGERTDYFANTSGTLAAVRQMYSLRLVGDVDDSAVVNVFDLLQLLTDWNGSGPSDVNGDGTVNVFDLLLLLTAWNNCL